MPSENRVQLEQAFADLDLQIDEINNELAKLRTFNGSSINRARLVQDIREVIKHTGLQFDRLKIEATRHGQTFQDSVSASQRSMNGLKSQFRKAIIKSEKDKHKQLKSDRDMLLAGAVSPSELRKWRSQSGNQMVNASNEVTGTLRETVQMMGSELEKSHANMAALKDSSSMISETKGRHEIMTDMMRISRSLITKLERADWVDRMLMLLAFLLFTGVVLNIIRRRIWLPGVGMLFRGMKLLLFGGLASVTETHVPNEAAYTATASALSIAEEVTMASLATATASVLMASIDDAFTDTIESIASAPFEKESGRTVRPKVPKRGTKKQQQQQQQRKHTEPNQMCKISLFDFNPTSEWTRAEL